MKKAISLLLSAALALGMLTGCGQTPSSVPHVPFYHPEKICQWKQTQYMVALFTKNSQKNPPE